MATINLGAIKFNWRGSYSGATAYVVDDVVESSGSSYICIAATTGNAPPNATYWEQMSSAGTNGTDGTDLTTTLTTQGDIVYRDASGLARLGAGTSGQVLQTNGTGANPSWGTVSSDMVKLTSVTLASDASSIDIDNLFSSTYRNYVCHYSGYASVAGGWINMRPINSSGTVVTANEQTTIMASATVSSSSANSTSTDVWNGTEFYLTQVGGNQAYPSTARLTFYNPENTIAYKNYTIETVGWDSTTQMRSSAGGGSWVNTGSQRGFRLFHGAGALKSGFRVDLYGIK